LWYGQPVSGRIIEPTSKLDSLRVLAKTGGAEVPSHATLNFAHDHWRPHLPKRRAEVA
jgi:hypothetical protein